MTYRLEPSLVELFDLRNEDGGFNESEYGDPHIWINADVFRRTGVVFQGQPGRLLAVDLSDGEGRRAASEFPGLLVALDTYLLANDLVS